VSRDGVEPLQELPPVRQLLRRDACTQTQVGDHERRGIGGIDHRLERLAGRAQPGRPRAWDHLGDHDIGRHGRVEMLLLPEYVGAATGHDVDLAIASRRVAGEANLVAVAMADVAILLTVGQTSDNRPFVHQAGGQGQQFGDSDAGNLGGDRVEFSAYLDGGVRFGVPHIVLAGAAAHPQNDDRFGAINRCAALGSLRLQAQKLRQ